MSDYLTNLVTRTLSPEAVVRPRLPSLLEPPPEGPTTTEEARLEELSPSSANRSEPTLTRRVRPPAPEGRTTSLLAPPARQLQPTPVPVPPVPRPSPPTENVTPPRPAQPAVIRPQLRETPGESLLPAPPRNVSEPRPPAALEASSLRLGNVPDEAREEQPPPAAADRGPPAVPTVQPALRTPFAGQPSLRPPAAPADRVRDQPGEAAPVIRVTIGRIDVRAVLPPAPPAPRPAAPTGPVLSLEEYLKQRDGGRR